MITLLFFISISGICSPIDTDQCDYTITYFPDSWAWGKYDEKSKTLYFGGEYWKEKDCLGINFWLHEWLHAKYGYFHKANQNCIIVNDSVLDYVRE